MVDALLEALATVRPEDELKQLHAEFVLRQLLLLAEFQDYSDEIGRRRMVASLRKVLVFEDVSPENMSTCAKGLLMAEDYSAFSELVVNVVHELEEAASAHPADMQLQGINVRDIAFLQTLEIIRAFLEALPQDLALQNKDLFLHLIQNNSKVIQKLALQTIFDLVVLFGSAIYDETTVSNIVKYGLNLGDVELLALVTEGACKLIMVKALNDTQVLEALGILYFHTTTQGQQRLRQCLSYFFPIYLLSSHEHQLVFSK
ncbi:hypothetical protein HK405_015202, partial [Cladochytrium tenue]